MKTETEKLEKIWNTAVENSTGEPDSYIGDDGKLEVVVKGTTLEFDVDNSTAIYYCTIRGGEDDLVYAKKALEEDYKPPEIVDSKEEFLDRVYSLVEEWNSRM